MLCSNAWCASPRKSASAENYSRLASATRQKTTVFEHPKDLNDDLRNLLRIACICALVWLFDQGYQPKHEEHEGHDGAPAHLAAITAGHTDACGERRVLNEGHHVDPTLDMQVTLGICVFLITIKVVFEVGKHKLENGVPPMMTSVMNAMFGELTVLGFIALVAYMLLRFGAISAVSRLVYHDPEHLLHLFEDSECSGIRIHVYTNAHLIRTRFRPLATQCIPCLPLHAAARPCCIHVRVASAEWVFGSCSWQSTSCSSSS